MPKGQHVPLRTCVVCGNKTVKADLVRIVATPSGEVKVDPTGKLPGRGAYVCADGKCAQESLGKSRIEHALRRQTGDENWARVEASIRALAGTD
jgi:hypothetical protein